jgi:hypothetical protein
MIKSSFGTIASVALLSLNLNGGAQAQQSSMTFFVTSTGSGKGADFGGLAGADKHCQSLAAAAGAGKRTWRAYLSTTGSGGSPAVNARDRIGKGPWRNAEGRLIARNLDELHSINNINRMTALTEKGGIVNGRADTPQHARYPHRLPAGWHRVRQRQGHDLRQLDEERRRHGNSRAPRPLGPA